MSVRRLALCVAAVAAFVCGCSTTVIREKPRNAAVAEALLAHVRGTDVQMVEGAWKDEPFVFECVLKGDGKTLSAVILAPHVRLATLTISQPHAIRWERAPQVPAALDPEFVAFDMALAFLPTAELGKAIGESWQVAETADGKRRTVSEARSGALRSVRQILPDGSIYLRNARFGYEMTIRTISHED